MKFKTTEWTMAVLAASSTVRTAGMQKLANHLDDLQAWILHNLEALEAIKPPPDPDKLPFYTRPTKTWARYWKCWTCHAVNHPRRRRCGNCHKPKPTGKAPF